MSPTVEVIRTYLELRSPTQLRGVSTTDPRITFERRDDISVERYRQLYEGVGARWLWVDRNAWNDERLATHLARPDITVWECCVDGESAGFFELERHSDGSVEVAYFGLLDAFIGQGLGKVMLTRAVDEAWELGATRVWLHTCTLDSPHALPNYKARGFEEVKRETYLVDVPSTD